MANSYTKISDTEIERTKQEDAPAPKIDKFNYDFLVQQKKDIEKQRDDYVAQRNIEIAEIDEMLEECGKLGILTAKVEEV